MILTVLPEGYDLSLVPVLHTEEWIKFAAELIEFRMRENKLTDNVFYGIDKLLMSYTDDTVFLLKYMLAYNRGYLVKDNGGYNGFVILTSISQYRAEITFCMFSRFRGRYMVAKGRALLKQLTERSELITIRNLYGFMALSNKPAVKYAGLIGFTRKTVFEGGYIDKFSGVSEDMLLVNFYIERNNNV